VLSFKSFHFCLPKATVNGSPIQMARWDLHGISRSKKTVRHLLSPYRRQMDCCEGRADPCGSFVLASDDGRIAEDVRRLTLEAVVAVSTISWNRSFAARPNTSSSGRQ
jgi:hypothetical protein